MQPNGYLNCHQLNLRSSQLVLRVPGQLLQIMRATSPPPTPPTSSTHWPLSFALSGGQQKLQGSQFIRPVLACLGACSTEFLQ